MGKQSGIERGKQILGKQEQHTCSGHVWPPEDPYVLERVGRWDARDHILCVQQGQGKW